jgi:hypothetical protein
MASHAVPAEVLFNPLWRFSKTRLPITVIFFGQIQDMLGLNVFFGKSSL